MSASLNEARRASELEALAGGETVDVVVVGGGVTGAGIALDAASRGLSVALLERRDLAHGTSRWSSKLVHGGLRYLEQGDVGLAWESAVERATLLRTVAPHLVRPIPHLIPLDAAVDRRTAAKTTVGLRIGDALRTAARTSRRVLPPPRRVSALEARRLAPALRPAGLRGALLSWDCQLEDDARLVVAIARTAAAHGARVLTYAEVTGLREDGVDAVDARTGAAFTRAGAAHDRRRRSVVRRADRGGVAAAEPRLAPARARRPARRPAGRDQRPRARRARPLGVRDPAHRRPGRDRADRRAGAGRARRRTRARPRRGGRAARPRVARRWTSRSALPTSPVATPGCGRSPPARARPPTSRAAT